MDPRFSTDDPKLVDEIVCELKSQGVFDQFRRNCISDVDTKPAYQNLRQRVENTVSNFLNEQVWRPDLNKNQLREKLRKHITEAGFLETGVERIVDQVVNPKINSIFLPKIEDISYKYLGIEKPKQAEEQTVHSGHFIGGEIKPNNLQTNLDLNDLEAVSPDSTASKKSFKDSTENLNISIVHSSQTDLNDSSEKPDDDFESPAFEPLKAGLLTDRDSINGEDDSKLSDISGLTSQDSVKSETIETETVATAPTIEVIEQPAIVQSQQIIPENINQDSVLSQVSSNSHLSIVTDSNNKSSEVDICEEAQMPKFSENSCNNPDMDDKEKKPLLTSFDIKQDEIIFEGTERHSSLHDLDNDIKLEEEVVDELKDSSEIIDSIGDESLIKTESSSSFTDPIISDTKELSLKDDCKSTDHEFKFEEPISSMDVTDVSTNQSQNDKNKNKHSKLEKKSDGKYEHKSYRRDKDKPSSSHHSRDKYKNNEKKHSSSSSSKHSSSSSSSKKDHRSESREGKKSSSSDHRREDSSRSSDRSSVKNVSSSYSSSRDKDGNHKSSRSHIEDKSNRTDRTDKERSDKSRSKNDRSSHKSRSQYRSSDEKNKHRTHDDDGKKKSIQDSTSKPKATDDDHASHREKNIERRRSTDRDSNDGSTPQKPAIANVQPEASVGNSSATTSSSSSSSTASSSNDQHVRQETEINQQSVDEEIRRLATSTTDSDHFVPSSVPVVVDEFLVGNDINLEMLMENSNVTTSDINPVMSMMIQQSMCDGNDLKIKKPKVASNIFEARKLMKVRKQIEREEKKRLEKLLVHTKQTVATTNYGIDEQGIELEFALMNSSAPSISSPIKSKEIVFEGPQTPAAVIDKRNSGEFIIDFKEMEKEIRSGKLSPKKSDKASTTAPKFIHKFDEILSQIDRPRKRDAKGSASPASPNIDKSPKIEPQQKKLTNEQNVEVIPAVESKKSSNLPAKSPPRQSRNEKSLVGTTPEGSNLKKNSGSPKTVSSSLSPKLEQKERKPNKTVSSTSGTKSSTKHDSKHQKSAPTSITKVSTKVNRADSTKEKQLDNKANPKIISKVDDNNEFDETGAFLGFSTEYLIYKRTDDFLKVGNHKILYLLNCDQTTNATFVNTKKVIWNIIDDGERLVSQKEQQLLAESIDPKLTDEKNEIKTSITSTNGIRMQQKLFVENNKFSGNSDGKQVSRKRKNSDNNQGTAAKFVRINCNEKTEITNPEGKSPTSSEQFKENQVIHQMKKAIAGRGTDNARTSDDFNNDQGQSATKIASNKTSQHYTSEDLYKTRPALSRTRRRGLETADI